MTLQVISGIAALGGIGLSVMAVAFCWWTARWARSAVERGDRQADRANDEATRKRQLELHADELRDSIRERDTAIETLEDDLHREQAARSELEGSLNETIEAMSKDGNMAAVAVGIRSHLERLRSLSQRKLPEVRSENPPTEGGDGS